MRSALLCVFFALAVGKEGRQAGAINDFQPMPIPLQDWSYAFRGPRVGTLHEAVRTEAPPTIAAVPAHYWEDALRHSVYLTLVRDKIDQLISKGAVISPDSKPDHYNSKEIEDYDLWDKIKSAPFDRLSDKELNSFGDVTVMAKGRLLEENNGFRFTEDERTNEKCNDESCMKGIRAIWSVKRVRQRDEEVSPGKHHYELTFSVMSQMTKKQRKPYENSVRTFTVRENPPESGPVRPQQKQYSYEPVRPQRAIWFHKNLVPNSGSQARRYQGLERIFMSLFSDEKETPKIRPPTYSPHQQLPKAPYGSSTEQYQQKKLLAYPYNPPLYKYVRHPLSPQILMSHQHFADTPDSTVLVKEQRYVAPSNVHKTTRPAVLPTPLPETETSIGDLTNDTETSTKETESNTPVYKSYSKPVPTKINYLPGHLRPPVYNAPPGVFVTLDKKPFKPLPPLKIHSYTNKHKHRPGDFRPSPQLLDMQFSDPESHSTADTAFRPIIPKITNKTTQSVGSKKGDKKTLTTYKRPPKKQGNIKAKPVTTSAPDIITVYNESLEDENDYGSDWTSLVGSFTGVTTPIKSPSTSTVKIPDDIEETTSSSPTPEDVISEDPTTAFPGNNNYTKKKRVVISTSTTEPSTTSHKPKRRTRPPPSFSNFTKTEKTKKNKRITTTTKSPEKQAKPGVDLTPLASSAATKPNKIWDSKNKTATTTETSNMVITVSSTTPSTTTRVTTTATARPVITTTAVYSTYKTTQPKNKNRFRQSTLMQKGTSVNHDKWSSTNTEKEKNKTVVLQTGFQQRRKASNFQKHATSTHRSIDVDHKEEDHADKKFSTADISAINVHKSTEEPAIYEETAEQDDMHNMDENKENENEGNATDEKEYIFDITSPTPNEKTNEISDAEDPITEETVTTPMNSVPKNKTKCKKRKKHENLMTSGERTIGTTSPQYESTTTIKSTTVADIFGLLGEINYDETTEKAEESASELVKEGSEKHEKFALIDAEVHDYLDELSKKKHNTQDEDQYEDEDDSKTAADFSPFNVTSEDAASKDTEDDDDNYDDYDRSVSFLELMAME